VPARLGERRRRALAERNRWYLGLQPRLRLLRRRLLELGGQEVVMQTEPYLQDLIDDAVTWRRAKPRLIRGRVNECHANVARVFQKDPSRYRIVTGWALHPNDCVWRSHSWLLEGDQLVETTFPARIYYGAVLSDWRGANFVRRELQTFVQRDTYRLARMVADLLAGPPAKPRKPRGAR
jgi:hypothetical protein